MDEYVNVSGFARCDVIIVMVDHIEARICPACGDCEFKWIAVCYC